MCKVTLFVALCTAVGTATAGPLAYGDPTEPTPLGRAGFDAAGEPVVERPPWELTSTLVARDRKVVVINGRSVPLGATIAGARVKAVDAGGAWIEHEGRRIRLDLPPPEGKTITAKTPTGR